MKTDTNNIILARKEHLSTISEVNKTLIYRLRVGTEKTTHIQFYYPQ